MQKSSSKNNIYTPAEDTFFLEDWLQHEKGQSALDIGAGSGYLSKILSQNFPLVVSTDIDHTSLASHDAQNRICCNAADGLNFQFDLVVCNMPYLPSEKITDRTVDGGAEGLEVPLGIIQSAKNCIKPGGRLLFLSSSLANYTQLIQKTKDLGFECSIVAKKKLFYEELILVQARRL